MNRWILLALIIMVGMVLWAVIIYGAYFVYDLFAH